MLAVRDRGYRRSLHRETHGEPRKREGYQFALTTIIVTAFGAQTQTKVIFENGASRRCSEIFLWIVCSAIAVSK